MASRENRTGIFELTQNPEIADLFRVALRGLSLSLRTHSVGTVVAYDTETQRASVRVDALQVLKDLGVEPTPANPLPESVQPAIVLKEIPVAFPRTSSGYLTFPISVGDTGELHVQDRNLSQWLEIGQATDPVSAFIHNLADSVFHPNIFPASNPIAPPTSQTATVLEGPAINLGAQAVDPIALATLTDQIFSILDGVFNGWTPVPNDGGAALKTAYLAAFPTGPASVASSKVSAE